MATVTVTQTSNDGKAEPTTIVWAREADDVTTMLAVAQLMQHEKNDEPWAPRILSITITY